MARLPKRGVLVLNKYYQGIHVCPIVRAVSLAFNGEAEIVHAMEEGFYPFNFEDWVSVYENPELAALDPEKEDVITTGSCKFFLPKVIRLLSSAYIPDGKRQLRPTRKNVFLRDEHTCQYCDFSGKEKDLNIDHVIPRSKGGKSNWDNLVTSCRKCNTDKADRTPGQAGMTLLRRPKKPRAMHFLSKKLDKRYLKEYMSLLGIKDEVA